jgi:peroxiredoxin
MIGAKPGVGQTVISWILPNVEGPDQKSPLADYSTELKTDAQGQFIMSRVPAGQVAVAPHPTPESSGRPMQEIEVQPGKTATVIVGGQGRPVVGRVLIPPSLAKRSDWTFRNCFVDPKIDLVPSPMPKGLTDAPLPEQAKWWQSFEKTDAAKFYQDAVDHRWDLFHARTYEFTIQPDGSFRVEDIVPGNYQVTFNVYTKKLANKPRQMLARGQVNFTVPPIPGGRTDDPLPIPNVQIDTSVLQDGDLAPDFTVPTLQGRQLKLSDFRGKYLVLDFWATWCGPCMAELDATKNLYQAFHSDPRFAMIGLSLDTQPNDPIQCIAKHDLSWNQALVGDWDNPTVKSYGVDSLGIPSLWLISPDGKVIAHSHSADQFRTILGNALGQRDANRP